MPPPRGAAHSMIGAAQRTVKRVCEFGVRNPTGPSCRVIARQVLDLLLLVRAVQCCLRFSGGVAWQAVAGSWSFPGRAGRPTADQVLPAGHRGPHGSEGPDAQ